MVVISVGLCTDSTLSHGNNTKNEIHSYVYAYKYVFNWLPQT